MRRINRPIAALASLFLALALYLCFAWDKEAEPPAMPAMEGKELNNFKAILRPARYDESDDKIELAVFFWYGCGACRESEATTTLFTGSLPEDVRVVRLPALFETRMPFQTHGRLFLVLDELGVETAARQAAFDTAQQIYNQNRRGYGLVTKESQETFAASQGVSRASFNATYDSLAVTGREARIKAFMDNSGLDAVPAMVINGRYVITYFDGPFYQLAEKTINYERERLAYEKQAKPEPAAETAGAAAPGPDKAKSE
ncbi:MAG: hypothetical protein LBU69_05285 [Deltaproteobacteria bacterium]|jgi:thiol:disulfide interchange protein DsbA|nr:hypothetical protein [Deltaproteobacteria bacterium]